MRAFTRVSTNDRILEQIQTNVELAFQYLQQALELNPRYIETSVAVTIDNIIPHNLGRAYKYFEIVSSDADCRVWLSSTTNNAKHQQIILKANTTANLTLRLF